MRLYHEKQLEIEYAKGTYFDKFSEILDETEPLNQHILRYTFIDWHLLSNLNVVKRKKRRSRRKEEKTEKRNASQRTTTVYCA